MSADKDEEDDRLYQPCSCDNCGHVSNWGSTLAEVWASKRSGVFQAKCEACGSTALRAGVTLPAPPMRQ